VVAVFVAVALRPQAEEQPHGEQVAKWPIPPEQDDLRELFSADDVFSPKEVAR
jgi:hypothetical protein